MSKPTADMCPRAFITGVVPLNAFDRGELLSPLHWLFTSSFLFRRPAYFAAVSTFTVWHRFFFLLPFYFVCPVCSRHFSFGNVIGVPCLKRLTFSLHLSRFTSLWFPCGLSPLLAKTYSFNFVTGLCDDDVAFLRVVGGALRFVVTAHSCSG